MARRVAIAALLALVAGTAVWAFRPGRAEVERPDAESADGPGAPTTRLAAPDAPIVDGYRMKDDVGFPVGAVDPTPGPGVFLARVEDVDGTPLAGRPVVLGVRAPLEDDPVADFEVDLGTRVS